MSGPIPGVYNGNNPWQGGSITPGSRPTDVGGTFTVTGQSTIPAVTPGQLQFARNFSSTNQRIPYSRLVPVTKADGPPGTVVTDESAGLNAGAIAWILRVGALPLVAPLGSGVDRMQRLATSTHVRSVMKELSKTKTITASGTSWQVGSSSGGIKPLSKGPFLRGLSAESGISKLPDGSFSNDGDLFVANELKKIMESAGFLEWKPDGVVLSKLADDSPGEVVDYRYGRLFNVSVQGPAICHEFTGSPDFQTFPLDKVYVLVVADVLCDGEGDPSSATAFTAADGGAKEVEDVMAQAGTDSSNKEWAELKTDTTDGGVTMANFRLMHATSTFLAEKSGKGVRCGLKVANKGSKYAASYILGGWQLGAVLDSAASRTTIGHQVKVSPGTYSSNVYVAVKWLSGDELARKYDNTSNRIRSVVQKPVSSDSNKVNRGLAEVAALDAGAA